jgi:hypothetical protein
LHTPPHWAPVTSSLRPSSSAAAHASAAVSGNRSNP